MTATADRRACTGPAASAVGVTVGVEEEFVVTDPAGVPVATAGAVLGSAAPDPVSADGELHAELAGCQLELATAVCTDGETVLTRLRRLRGHLAGAARQHGWLLLAAGTPPLTGAARSLTSDHRYRRMAGHYRALTDTAHVCGCHVHVGVPDREAGLRVSNHLRSWLPVLLAASANSPFTAGLDSGYASWRHQLLMQWPASGPPPYFDSLDQHDTTLAALARSGGVLDPAAVYWAVRLSPRYPTVELRVCDVAPTAQEATLLAVLVRALAVLGAATPAAESDRVPDEVLRADLWRAARDGLAGRCAAPAGTAPVPAAAALWRLVEHVRPALCASGEQELVESLVRTLLRGGDGATRQRVAYRWRGRLSDVAAVLAVPTSAGRLAPG